jgi:coiled-coil and C2 domain-containing protein 2A
VPPVIIGYDQDSGRPPSLHVYITLRPRLAPPVTSSEELVAGESDEVVRHARK